MGKSGDVLARAGKKKQGARGINMRKLGTEAEKKVALRASKTSSLKKQDLDKLARELEVHQVQLEAQNEELRTTRALLDEARSRYFELYDQAPIGYFSISEKGIIIEANLTGAEMLGMVPRDLRSKRFSSYIFKEDLDIYYLHRRALFETGKPQSCDIRMIRGDNCTFWAQVEARLRQDDKTGKQVCHAMVSNITERKKAEEGLQESERQLRAILDATPFPVALVDIQDNKIQFWSHSAQTLFGHTAPTAPEWYEIAYPDPDYRQNVIDRWKPFLEKARFSGQPVNTGEYRVTCRDGSIRICELYATFLPDKLIVTFNDITDRRRAEQALQDRQEMLNSLLNSITESALLIKADGTILAANAAAASRLGNRGKDIVGFNVYTLLPDPIAEFRKNMVEKAIITKQAVKFDDVRRDRYIGNSIYPIVGLNGVIDRAAIFGIDLTERKLAEDALAESEERYRLLASNSEDVIWTTDLQFRFTYISPSVYKLRGLTQEEAMKQDVMDTLTPDSRQRVQTLIESRMPEVDKGMPVSARLDIEQYCKDGSTVWVEVAITTLLDDAGVLKGFVGVSRNIAERKKMHEEVLSNKVKLDNALQSSNMGVWSWEINENKRIFDDQVCALLGLNPETFSGTAEEFFNVVHPDDIAVIKEALARTIEQDIPYNPEYRAVWHDGSIHFINARGRLMRDDQGRPLRISGIIWDNSKRKMAEEALSESETKYHNLIELLHEGIWVIDENARTTYVNIHMAKMLGYTIKEMMGKDIFYFMDEKIREIAAQNLGSRRNGISATQDLELLKKDGTTIYISLSSAPIIDKDGKFKGAIAGVQDITEHRHLEDEERRVAKLESVGLLAGGIAHDFNNILTSILGNVSMAKIDTEPESDIYKSLEQAEKASQRAKELTRQLLTFSKGGAPVTKLASLTELITDTAGFALRGSNVKCHFSIPDDLWHAEVDIGQVSQVIQNLVINAQQSMPTGGTIEIIAENISLSETQTLGRGLPLNQGNYIRISVVDHGSGIAAAHFDKVFDPFFTTKKKGSGLGLATSFSIARQHGGHLSVESEPGSGSTFYLYLPASMEIMPPKLYKKEAIKAKGKARILVMDDERGIREIAGRMLGNLGYKDIEFAENGAEAIKIYKVAMVSGKPFSAVILDLTIPGGMGGKETVGKLLKLDPGVKALVSSGYVDDSIIANYKEHGFGGIVVKPYTLEELGKAVYDLIA